VTGRNAREHTSPQEDFNQFETEPDRLSDLTEQVERTYHAICLRQPIGSRGIVESKIARDPKDRKKMAAMPLHVSRSDIDPVYF
jgi:23S rRNA-/tRNA-specific pseudouridylate synthase